MIEVVLFAISVLLGLLLVAVGFAVDCLMRIADALEGSRPPVLPSVPSGMHDLVSELRALRLWLRETVEGFKRK